MTGLRGGVEVKIGDRPLLLRVVVLAAAKPRWPRCGSDTHHGSSRVGEVLTVYVGGNVKGTGGWSRGW